LLFFDVLICIRDVPKVTTSLPTQATMAHLPFFNSAALNQRRVSSLPRVARFKGSKFFRGAEAPPISSRVSEIWVLTGCVCWKGVEELIV
jgi:hypothetical protein